MVQAVRIEVRAMTEAAAYFRRRGFEVDDVSRSRAHPGHDLVLRCGRKRLSVEVKGCSREWGIQDLYESEVDARGRLVADYLCIVYFVPGRERTFCVVPRDEIPPECVRPKRGWRISGAFKNEAALGPFVGGGPRAPSRRSVGPSR